MSALRKLLFSFFIIVTAIFLFSPRVIFATFDITAISPSTIISSDEIITVVATVSGLRSNPQYLQMGLTLSGATTKLFGITKNNGDEWYYYEGSPTASDLTATFYSFTHNDGSWSGQVFGKVDINHSGYYGPGEYKLRLYKYTISSSQNVSSSYVEWESTITVDIPPPPTPTPSPTSTSTPQPTSTPKLTNTPTQKILTPTPSQKISPTPTPKKSNQTATDSGEVLGEEVASFSAFYPYEATDEAEKNEATPSARNKILPKIFLIGGLLLLFASACWVWYNFVRNYRGKHSAEV